MSKSRRKQLRIAAYAILAVWIAASLLQWTSWLPEQPVDHRVDAIGDDAGASEGIAASPELLMPASSRERVADGEQAATRALSVELYGQVDGKRFGTPLSEARIELQLPADGTRPSRMYHTVADVRGQYSIFMEIPDPIPGKALTAIAKVDHPLSASATITLHLDLLVPSLDNQPQRIQRDLVVDRVFPIEGHLIPGSRVDLATAEVILVSGLNGPNPLRHLAPMQVQDTGAFRGVLLEWPQEPVAVVAIVADAVPAYREFAVDRSSVTDVGGIAFDFGVSISGRVVTSYPEGAQSRSLSVQEVMSAKGLLFHSVHSGSYVWPNRGLPATSVRLIAIQEDGTFYIGGLVPGRYFLNIRHNCGLRGNGTSLRVSAPATDVVLEDKSAMYLVAGIDIGTGEELQPAKLQWDHLSNFYCWVGSGWEKGISLKPRVDHSGWLVAEGYYPEKVFLPGLETGMVGTLTIPLSPLSGPALTEERTRLSVVDEDGHPVARLLMSIELQDSPVTKLKYTTHQNHRSSEGVYSLPPLLPGTYVVRLNANTMTDLFRSPLVVHSFVHTVPQKKGARRDVVMVKGGSVVVDLRAQGTGERIVGHLDIPELETSAPLAWIPNDDGMIGVYFDWTPGRSEVRLKNALPDGTYTLVASADGFLSSKQEFIVSGANDTILKIELEKVQ